MTVFGRDDADIKSGDEVLHTPAQGSTLIFLKALSELVGLRIPRAEAQTAQRISFTPEDVVNKDFYARFFVNSTLANKTQPHIDFENHFSNMPPQHRSYFNSIMQLVIPVENLRPFIKQSCILAVASLCASSYTTELCVNDIDVLVKNISTIRMYFDGLSSNGDKSDIVKAWAVWSAKKLNPRLAQEG